MTADCMGCDRWARLPFGSAGWKAGLCGLDGRQRLAPETCALHRPRPLDWAAWGLAPPAPPAGTAITAAQAAAAEQLGLL